jgi:hypothetical protein
MRQLLASKKFIVMTAAAVVAIASKLGLDLDPHLVQLLVYLAIAFIVGQGIADHGKEAAKIVAAAAGPVTTTTTETIDDAVNGLTTKKVETTIKPSQAGFANIGLLLTVSAVLGLAMVTMSCGQAKHSASSVDGATMNCLTDQVQALTQEFGPAMKTTVLGAYDPFTREVDWTFVKQAAWSFAKDSGMCVLANVVADILDPPAPTRESPQSATVDIDPRLLRSGFAKNAGAVRYATRAGLL